jgi:uncharacterized protein (TIGR02594 family)
MRKIIIPFVAVLFLAACDANSTAIVNPVLHASTKLGLEERKDRAELKELTGVDPVRTEWCAAFVNAVLNESGIPGSESVSKYPLTARSFTSWGETVSKEDIQSGDIVVFPRGDVSWQGHVGFYVKTVEKNGVNYYAILGGNQSNKVSIELYRANRALTIRRFNLDSLLVP